MKRKAYHRLELTMLEMSSTDIVRTSGGGGEEGFMWSSYDVLSNDKNWVTN